MRLTRLVTHQFRNLQPCDLATDVPFVVLHGPNAQGKTNALEAVYLISTLKALRARRRSELVQWKTEAASVSGWVRSEDITRQYRVDLTPKQRQVSLDGKRVGDLVDWFGGIRCICFTPLDARIVSGEPTFRRQWLDRAAFTAWPVHLHAVRNHRRVLAQKGAALRAESVDHAVLDALDQQLAVSGAEVVERRLALLRELEPHIRDVHRTLAGGSGSLRFRVRTDAVGGSRGERAAALLLRLGEVRAQEVRRRMTVVGPQTDEIVLLLDDRPMRTYGSRGQVRSLVLSLKLAELVAARARGDVPLFLLDDVSSELDRDRTRRLVGALSDLGAQVWATTTDADHIDGLPRANTLRIAVDGGSLSIS
jgi:DNA replication and repair protein RecF